MGWFKPTPIELQYGEPIHQMVARALLAGAMKVSRDRIISHVSYHFVGPHGASYSGEEGDWHDDMSTVVAKICERVQADFNERTAAMTTAREYAKEQLATPPLFKTLIKEAT